MSGLFPAPSPCVQNVQNSVHAAAGLSRGRSCECVALMDGICAAAATVAVSMDREDSSDLAVETTPGSVAAVDVLLSIDANRGVWCMPDPRSHFPLKSRGASCSHTAPSTLAIFGPGRDDRKRAGRGPRRALRGQGGAACHRCGRCASAAGHHHVLRRYGRGSGLRRGAGHVGAVLWPHEGRREGRRGAARSSIRSARRASPVWAPRQVRRAGHAHRRRPRAPADAVGAGGARRQGRGQAPKAKLELAQVRYRHALRRLQCAYPGELCGFSQNSAREMVHWAIRVEALAGPVPAARAAACKVGFDFNTAVSNTRNQLEMARDRS